MHNTDGCALNDSKITRTKMLDYRRKEAIPDVSYDLDGDGFVGGKDYVVARKFDKGFKNYLTTEERAEAFEALKKVSIFQILLIVLNRALKIATLGMSRLVVVKDHLE